MIDFKKKLRIWIFFNIAICAIPFIIYIYKFHSYPFSDKPDDWTSFANYISNILSPILSSFNIYFLIKLTYEVADYNQKNTKNEMKQSAYVELSKRLYSFTSVIQNSDAKQRDLDLMRNDIISFSSTMKHLFGIPNIEKLTDEIDDSLKAISECSFLQGEMLEDEDSTDYKDFILLCKAFDVKRIFLITELQKSILN